MVEISFLKPLEQPVGDRRFLGELERCLDDPDFNSFRFAVAFAKTGPFFRLANRFENWKIAGKSVEAIFGIDHLGTSQQVLEFALQNFSKVYVTHVDFIQSSRVTFHPKQYLFYGDHSAVCYVGSHNMTTGGTETNFEAGVRIKMNRPEDETIFQDALQAWTTILPAQDISTRELTNELLEELILAGLLLDERRSARQNEEVSTSVAKNTPRQRLFPKLKFRPASSLPQRQVHKLTVQRSGGNKQEVATVATPATSAAQTFVIQIAPRNNGEIHLSYIAVRQNPDFFEYPFEGLTTPKSNRQNAPYPQRDPDPVVDIFIYNEHNDLKRSIQSYGLNTVDYEKNKEIRITFPSEVAREIPHYSVMVLEKSDRSDLDYVIHIYPPESPGYTRYLEACDQKLPSGGKAVPRRMGWL